MNIPDEIFLLYGGQSEDGRGEARFEKRTLDAPAAFKHWEECRKNPYSTGKVELLTADALYSLDTWHWANQFNMRSA